MSNFNGIAIAICCLYLISSVCNFSNTAEEKDFEKYDSKHEAIQDENEYNQEQFNYGVRVRKNSDQQQEEKRATKLEKEKYFKDKYGSKSKLNTKLKSKTRPPEEERDNFLFGNFDYPYQDNFLIGNLDKKYDPESSIEEKFRDLESKHGSKPQTLKIVPPKVEPPKVEPPRVEPPKVELPKIEPPKVEPPKVEPPIIVPPIDAPLKTAQTSEIPLDIPKSELKNLVERPFLERHAGEPNYYDGWIPEDRLDRRMYDITVFPPNEEGMQDAVRRVLMCETHGCYGWYDEYIPVMTKEQFFKEFPGYSPRPLFDEEGNYIDNAPPPTTQPPQADTQQRQIEMCQCPCRITILTVPL